MEKPPESKRTPKGVDLRLVTVTCMAWFGALVGLQLGPIEDRYLRVGVPVVVGMVTVVVAVISRSALGRGAALLVWVSIVGIWTSGIVAWTAAASFVHDPIQTAAVERNYARVLVTVIGPPKPANSPWSTDLLEVELQTKALCPSEIRDGPAECDVPSSVTLRGEVAAETSGMDDLIPGSRLEARGIVSKEDWLAPPVAAKLEIIGYSVEKSAPKWQSWAASLRKSMRETTASAGAVGPLISGMAIGDDALLSKDLKDSMLTSSLTHLTAVSGSHIAISLALITRVFRGRRGLQALSIGVFLVLVVIVVGPEPSVVRAVSMSSLAVWGMIRRRPSQPLRLLATVVLVSVIIEPWLAVSVGFALSVAATAGIIVIARPLERLMARVLPEEGFLRQPAKPAIVAVAVAVSAQVVTLPILALFNDWLPTWGVVANLLVAPVVPVMTILGLGAAVFLWLPPLSDFLIVLARPAAEWMAWVSTTAASWPLARFPWIQGWPGAVLAVLATFTAVGVFRLAGVLVISVRNAIRRSRAKVLLAASMTTEISEIESLRRVNEKEATSFD
ncbi:MAG: ComEC/Rec2 family competence protein [Scrofimicrobium sp.]